VGCKSGELKKGLVKTRCESIFGGFVAASMPLRVLTKPSRREGTIEFWNNTL
jgi:hypothetical protein